MANSTHTYAPDNRNESILININGSLIAREQATVSVFDSGFILGDGIWEGLRVHSGAIPFLGRHLKRLWEGAPSQRRLRCRPKKGMAPLCTRRPSQIPSPRIKPLSNTETVACSRAINDPLILMSIDSLRLSGA